MITIKIDTDDKMTDYWYVEIEGERTNLISVVKKDTANFTLDADVKSVIRRDAELLEKQHDTV